MLHFPIILSSHFSRRNLWIGNHTLKSSLLFLITMLFRLFIIEHCLLPEKHSFPMLLGIIRIRREFKRLLMNYFRRLYQIKHENLFNFPMVQLLLFNFWKVFYWTASTSVDDNFLFTFWEIFFNFVLRVLLEEHWVVVHDSGHFTSEVSFPTSVGLVSDCVSPAEDLFRGITEKTKNNLWPLSKVVVLLLGLCLCGPFQIVQMVQSLLDC